jgi:hypothetical protein
MINKSNMSPIVVIGFLIISLSMIAPVNIHAGGPQTIECKKVKATTSRIEQIMQLSKELGRNRENRAAAGSLYVAAWEMWRTYGHLNQDACR